ncbi:MAG: hypothetical protein Q9160_002192 [Pyrenula sp. 1 TL-2023]
MCGILQGLYPGKVSLQSSPGYLAQQANYWSSRQAEVAPRCRIQPTAASDVSAIVVVADYTGCQFAVKGGGHATFQGASNIEDGITIDFGQMKTLSVSADQKVTQVGPGNTWVDVYSYLTPQGLIVIGGRVAAIGMGLLLGGGISFLSNQYGWACDNINSYEIVNATGDILTVDRATEPDLFWALRGGGNNFGIVTRFDLATYPQGLFFGGEVYYSATSNNSLSMFNAFSHFTDRVVSDPKAALILGSAYVQVSDSWLFTNSYEYADPVPIAPPIFDEFLAIEPKVASTLRVATMSDLALELNSYQPNGLRETYIAATFKIDPTFMYDAYFDFRDSVKSLQPQPLGILPAIIFQPIGLNELNFMLKDGGNALGLSPEEGPLLLLSLGVGWSNLADDARILAMTEAWMDRTIEAGKNRGLFHRYVYQNYAGKNQDVFAGYGEENLQKLRDISRRYDPSGVFQRLQPGYFKLGL